MTYHPTIAEHLVCAAGQSESTCTPAAAAGYSQTKSTLTELATSVAGGSSVPLMYVETESLVHTGSATADGARRADTKHFLYADAANYRLVVTLETDQVLASGTFAVYGKTTRIWDSSYKVPHEETVWNNTGDTSTTRREFDLTTGNVTTIYKPVQWAAGGALGTSLIYDSRKLFVAGEINELGHVRDFTWEYGTGTKLGTFGPNVPACAATPPANCPAGTPLKEEHRIRVDGMGRMIERFESFDSGTGYLLHKVETNSYVDFLVPGPSITHQVAIDETGGVVRYAQDKTELDGLGRPKRRVITAVAPMVADQVTIYQYRNDGTLAAVIAPDPSVNSAATVSYSYTFDSLGRPTSIRRPDGPIGSQSGVNIEYVGLSQTSTEAVNSGDGTAASTTTYNDIFGRLVRVDERRSVSPIAWSTTLYTYTADDNVKTITDPEGNVTTLTHDWAGRRTQITRGGRTWSYGYDKNGNLTTETTPCVPGAGCPTNFITTIAYDALDRPSSKALAPRALTPADRQLFGAHNEVFTWDGGTNGKGRMQKWESFGTSGPAVTSLTPTYNAQGQPLNLAQTTNAAGYTNLSRSFGRTYHVSGAVREVNYGDVVGSTCASGSRATYSYDGRGLPYDVKMETCVGATGGTTQPASFVRNTRNVAGLVTKRNSVASIGTITYAESTWSYDKLGRVTSQVIQKGSPLSQVARQDLQYFGNDDPKQMNHWLGASNQKQFTFGYDGRHQLTSVAESLLPNAFTATYAYGAAGRFTSAVESAAALPNSDVTARNVLYQYDTVDKERLLRLRKNPGTKNLAEYTYDEPGNQLTRYYPDTKELWEYVYDGKNQLRRVTKKLNNVIQGREEYWYDEKNTRYLVVKYNGALTKTGATWFLEETEATYDAPGNVTRVFAHVSMGTPVARLDRRSSAPAAVEYQFHGLANNTLATVDQASGTINASFMYAPFGEIIEATNGGGATNGLAAHRRRLNDKHVDEVSGLSYYGFRYYDRLSMTWTQADPLYRFAADNARNEPRRAGLYTTSLNNPARFVDPTGLDPLDGYGDYVPGGGCGSIDTSTACTHRHVYGGQTPYGRVPEGDGSSRRGQSDERLATQRMKALFAGKLLLFETNALRPALSDPSASGPALLRFFKTFVAAQLTTQRGRETIAATSRKPILPVLWGKHGKNGFDQIRHSNTNVAVLFLDEGAESARSVPGASQNPDVILQHELLHWTVTSDELKVRQLENRYREERGIGPREVFQNIQSGF